MFKLKPGKKLQPVKWKRKKKYAKIFFTHPGLPLPSPDFLNLLDILGALDFLDALLGVNSPASSPKRPQS